jgi:hypothetical protein
MNSRAFIVGSLSLSLDTNANCSSKVVISSNFFLCNASSAHLFLMIASLASTLSKNLEIMHASFQHSMTVDAVTPSKLGFEQNF